MPLLVLVLLLMFGPHNVITILIVLKKKKILSESQGQDKKVGLLTDFLDV